MRARLTLNNLQCLFENIALQGYDIKHVAQKLNVHPRTVRDWKRGKFTIPLQHVVSLSSIAKIDIALLEVQELPNWWQTNEAGKKGGISSFAKYGSPGTVISRKAGGVASHLKRSIIPNDIFTRKVVKRPITSFELAEFIGIMIGDGTVNKYQSSVALNMTTDKEYITYVAGLIQALFNIDPTFQLREKANCVCLVMSSATLSEYLVELGLPFGDKIRGGLDIPAWIKEDNDYLKACLRGIFDTDGSIYQEIHKYSSRLYPYPRMAFVSYSPPLRESISMSLNELGINAKIRNSRSVNIERFTDIEEYFRMVGSSNPKHVNRFIAFGGVG